MGLTAVRGYTPTGHWLCREVKPQSELKACVETAIERVFAALEGMAQRKP